MLWASYSWFKIDNFFEALITHHIKLYLTSSHVCSWMSYTGLSCPIKYNTFIQLRGPWPCSLILCHPLLDVEFHLWLKRPGRRFSRTACEDNTRPETPLKYVFKAWTCYLASIFESVIVIWVAMTLKVWKSMLIVAFLESMTPAVPAISGTGWSWCGKRRHLRRESFGESSQGEGSVCKQPAAKFIFSSKWWKQSYHSNLPSLSNSPHKDCFSFQWNSRRALHLYFSHK